MLCVAGKNQSQGAGCATRAAACTGKRRTFHVALQLPAERDAGALQLLSQVLNLLLAQHCSHLRLLQSRASPLQRHVLLLALGMHHRRLVPGLFQLGVERFDIGITAPNTLLQRLHLQAALLAHTHGLAFHRPASSFRLIKVTAQALHGVRNLLELSTDSAAVALLLGQGQSHRHVTQALYQRRRVPHGARSGRPHRRRASNCLLPRHAAHLARRR